MVVSAMKMETAVTAPCAGVIGAIAPDEVGSIAAGQIVATIARLRAASRAARGTMARIHGRQCWPGERPAGIAHNRFAPGSTDPGVVRQRDRGKLTCRERIDLLLDEGSFREVGSLAGFASYDDEGRVAGFTPANHVGGWGKIRRVRPWSAPTTSPRAAAIPTARSGPRAAIWTGSLAAMHAARPCVCWTARPAAAARRLHGPGAGANRRKRGQGERRGDHGGAAARFRRRRLLPARPSGLVHVRRTAGPCAGGKPPLGQRRRHRRGQGGARPLLGDGARHRPALRRRPAGGQPRHGL